MRNKNRLGKFNVPDRESQFAQAIDCTLNVLLGAFEYPNRRSYLSFPRVSLFKGLAELAYDKLGQGVSGPLPVTAACHVKVKMRGSAEKR
jgi:hypothetical protein